MKTIILNTFIVIISLVSPTVHSTPIASFDYHTAGGQSGPEFHYLDLELYITDINSSYIYAHDYKLFDNFVFGVEDLGITYTSTEYTDSGYADFTEHLTNGIENKMTVLTLNSTSKAGSGSGGGSIKSESEWLFGSNGLGDLSGYVIESVDVTVNSIAFYQDYAVFPHLIVNYWAEADFNITFNGYQATVPEPNIFSLLFLGLVGLVATGAYRKQANE